MLPNVIAAAKNQIDECLWAVQYPELQKACFLARVCIVQPPKNCQFRNIAGMLQVGPTCGLTALSMLLGGAPPPEELLATARQHQYTNNGEMFSARNLFELICDSLMPCLKVPPTPTTTTTPTTIPTTALASASAPLTAAMPVPAAMTNPPQCIMHEGRLNCVKVRESLMMGDCLFVPYDPDFNHAPCLKSGHKAHWALIIGFLISDQDEFFVLARHGKARNLAVWSLEALSDSNSNLIEFAQPKGYPDCDFLLPPGGIGGNLGLKDRAIIVKYLRNEIISIR